jgi:hypothetical protein
MRAKRFAAGGGPITVGGESSIPDDPSANVTVTPISQEVLRPIGAPPMMKAKKGGYVKAADGRAIRGKTKGRYL